MDNLVEGNVNYKLAKRSINLQCYYLGTAAVLVFSAFIGVVCLQSSINIDRELGTTSLAVAYATSALAGLTFNSYLLRYLGPKRGILLSDVLYIIYTLANIYPKPYTLLPAAICIGVAQTLTFTSIYVFLPHFGNQYHRVKTIENEQTKNNVKIKNAGAYARRFTGKFFAVMSIYLVIGNLGTYLTIHLGKTIGDNQQLSNEITNTTTNATLNYESNTTTTNEYRYCASNQCPFTEDLNKDDINKYEIESFTLKLLLFGFYTLLQLVGFFIHFFLIKDPRNISRQNSMKLLNVDTNENVSELKILNDEKESKTVVKETSKINGFLQSLVELWKHILTKQQLLIVPMNFHYGLITAFMFGDFTRSYIACLHTVEYVGLVMTFLGFFDIISCTFFERFSPKFGRRVFGILIFILEIFILTFSLFWNPNNDNKWVVPFTLAALWAISDGFRQSNLAATYFEYFPVKSELGFSTCAMLTCSGSTLTYISGRFLCVNQKLYILMCSSFISYSLFFIAEHNFRKGKNNKS